MTEPSGRRIWAFIGLTVVLSWPLWAASGVLQRGGAGAYDYRWLVAQVGVFAPSFSALVVSAAARRRLTGNSLRVLPVLVFPLVVPGILIAARAPSGGAEFDGTLLLVSVLVAAAVVLFFSPLNRRLLLPGTGESQGRPGAGTLLLSVVFFLGFFALAALLSKLRAVGSPPVAGGAAHGPLWLLLVAFSHNLLLGGSLGEETGWRGFLLPELLRRHGPLAASILLAVVWALWHLPIDLYSGFLLSGPAALLVRFLWVLPISVIFTWFYLRSRGSLLVAIFLHTSINVAPDLGLSRTASSLAFFFIFVLIAALAIAFASREFRRGS